MEFHTRFQELNVKRDLNMSLLIISSDKTYFSRQIKSSEWNSHQIATNNFGFKTYNSSTIEFSSE